MSNNFIRDFRKFQTKKRNEVSEKIINKEVNEVEESSEEKVEESVVVRDNKYVVGGVVVEQSFINSYIKKVKDQTGKTLRQMYSDQDIAEQLVTYLVDAHGDVENIPVSALLGGEEGMEEEVEDIDMEEAPADVEDDSIMDEEPAVEEAPAELEEGGAEEEESFDGDDEFEQAFEEGEGEEEAEGEEGLDFDAEVEGEEGAEGAEGAEGEEGTEEVDLFADDAEEDEDEENIFDETGETKDEEDEDDLPL